MSPRQTQAMAERPAVRSGQTAAQVDHGSRDLFIQRQGSGTPALGQHVSDTLCSGSALLAPEIRSDMEQRFGRDFSHVQVHDDARAHDSARAASAAAYTVGDHVVFGASRYQPQTAGGRHLLAHELAHTVQQAGLQRRGTDGLQASDDATLEAEADRAAGAAVRGQPATPLTTLGAVRLSRASDEVSAQTGTGPTEPAEDAPNPALLAKLRSAPTARSVSERWVSDSKKQVSVTLSTFASDKPKGPASSTNAILARRGSAKSLVFAASVKASKVITLTKETDSKTKDYTGVWLSNYGFASLQQLSSKLTAYRNTDAGKGEATGEHIDKIAKVFAQGHLTGTGKRETDANVDHIVEKQLQGQSIAENMQLLNGAENQLAGTSLNAKIVSTANSILADLADSSVEAICLRFDNIVYPDGGANDGITRIEQLLKDGTTLKGELSGAAMGGTRTQLISGGSRATIHIGKGKGKTDIATNGTNDLARALIPALTLMYYDRPGAKPSKDETIEAKVNPKRLGAIIPKPDASITLNATEVTEAVEGTADATVPRGNSVEALPARRLSLPPSKTDYKFVFPYLSPGRFTRFGLDAKGGLTADGTITPSIKFIKEIGVKLEGDELSLAADLGTERFQPPFNGMRITDAALSMKLAPEFRPSGHIHFEVGPQGKPYVLGKVTAGVEGSAFVANGDLIGQNIPGVSDAKGKVRYSTIDGWSGQVTASTSKIPNVKQAQVTFGFSSSAASARFYATGGIDLDIGKGKDLRIDARYDSGAIVYAGQLIWQKPLKLVDKVTLAFTYDGTTLIGTGSVPVTYSRSGATFAGDLSVTYLKKGQEDGRIFGKGKLGVKTPKVDGFLDIHVDDKGVIWGEGSVAYQINDKIKPTVGVKLSPEGKITLLGKIELTKPIVLFPAREGARDLIKVNMDFIIPGPFPGLADPMVHLGAGVHFSYGIGPGHIVNTVIEGSFDPFEDDKSAQLKLTSTFEVPGQVGLRGILEAGLGIAVLGGVGAKVHGGLRLEPGFVLKLTTAVPIVAQYAHGDFEFEGRIEMTGGLTLGLGINFYAHAQALAGAANKDYDWTIKNYTYDAGQQMKLTLAKLGYSTKSGVKWPALSDIVIEPKSLDPIAMIKKTAQSAKAALGG